MSGRAVKDTIKEGNYLYALAANEHLVDYPSIILWKNMILLAVTVWFRYLAQETVCKFKKVLDLGEKAN